MPPARISERTFSPQTDRLPRLHASVLDGLLSSPKRIPSEFFYDDEGSRLFQRISDCPDYYLTQTEAEILKNHASDVQRHFPSGVAAIVDLGAGDGRKSSLVLEAFRRKSLDVIYAPVDISNGSLEELHSAMAQRAEKTPTDAVQLPFLEGLHLLRTRYDCPILAMLLGSTIGNLDDVEALDLLSQIERTMRSDDRLLVGFDLLKDVSLLKRAYDDPQGITAAFNYNLLVRINRELGGDFNVRLFRHYALWNPVGQRMESYLLSLVDQTASILGRNIRLHQWEAIHTENSRKYRPVEVLRLANAARLRVLETYYDKRKWFLCAVLSPQRCHVNR